MASCVKHGEWEPKYFACPKCFKDGDVRQLLPVIEDKKGEADRLAVALKAHASWLRHTYPHATVIPSEIEAAADLLLSAEVSSAQSASHGDKHDLLLRLNDQRITEFNAVMRIREEAVEHIKRMEHELAQARRALMPSVGGARALAEQAYELYEHQLETAPRGTGVKGCFIAALEKFLTRFHAPSAEASSDLVRRLRAVADDKEMTIKILNGDHRVIAPAALLREAADALTLSETASINAAPPVKDLAAGIGRESGVSSEGNSAAAAPDDKRHPLSAEQIEGLRGFLHDMNEDPSDSFIAEINGLCDMALRSLRSAEQRTDGSITVEGYRFPASLAARSPLGGLADILAEYDRIVEERLDPRDAEADFVMRGPDWRVIRESLRSHDQRSGTMCKEELVNVRLCDCEAECLRRTDSGVKP